jgi:hypothetical protein
MKLRGGEYSTGTTGNFQSELTQANCIANRCRIIRKKWAKRKRSS